MCTVVTGGIIMLLRPRSIAIIPLSASEGSEIAWQRTAWVAAFCRCLSSHQVPPVVVPCWSHAGCRCNYMHLNFHIRHRSGTATEWAGWGKRFSGMQLLAFNVDLVASALLVVRYYQWKGSCTGTQTCARPVGTLLSFACTNIDTPVYVHFSKHTRSRAVDVFVHNE